MRPIAKVHKKLDTTTASSYFYTVNNLGQRTNVETNGTAFVGSPTLNKTYTWGLDLSGFMQGAGGVGGLLLITDHSALATSYFPTFDGNGNVSEYLNSTGAVAAQYEYDPFGNTTVATKPLDSEAVLYCYGYRFYDPATGRWSFRDPIEEQGGINLYGFVGNDGVNKWGKLVMRGRPARPACCCQTQMTSAQSCCDGKTIYLRDGNGGQRGNWSPDSPCCLFKCDGSLGIKKQRVHASYGGDWKKCIKAEGDLTDAAMGSLTTVILNQLASGTPDTTALAGIGDALVSSSYRCAERICTEL